MTNKRSETGLTFWCRSRKDSNRHRTWKKKIERNNNYNLKSEDYVRAETGDKGVSITSTYVVFLKGNCEKTGD